jgi:hypothetical protein
MERARSGLVALVGLTLVAGVCGGSASGSGVVVTPKCIAAYACAEVVVVAVPPPASGPFPLAGSGAAVDEDSALPRGILCGVNLGVENGTCAYTYSWPIGTTPPLVDVFSTGAQGSVVCDELAHPGCAIQADYDLSDFGLNYVFQPVAGSVRTLEFTWALSNVTVSVSRSGEGSGTVVGNLGTVGKAGGPAATTSTSTAAGINCGSQCTAVFGYGQQVVLAARPDAGAVFKQWTGACAGQSAICSLTLKNDASTNAVFALASPTTAATTTTTTPTTTTTTTPTTTTTAATTTTTATPNHGLDAQLIDIKPGKSRLGLRIEKVEIQTSETVEATLLLSRNGRQLAHASIPNIQPSDRVLILPIPKAVAKGKATLTIVLTDSAGNHRSWTRFVAVAH